MNLQARTHLRLAIRNLKLAYKCYLWEFQAERDYQKWLNKRDDKRYNKVDIKPETIHIYEEL